MKVSGFALSELQRVLALLYFPVHCAGFCLLYTPLCVVKASGFALSELQRVLALLYFPVHCAGFCLLYTPLCVVRASGYVPVPALNALAETFSHVSDPIVFTPVFMQRDCGFCNGAEPVRLICRIGFVHLHDCA
jgi:hypothetical protein